MIEPSESMLLQHHGQPSSCCQETLQRADTVSCAAHAPSWAHEDSPKSELRDFLSKLAIDLCESELSSSRARPLRGFALRGGASLHAPGRTVDD